MTQEEMQAHAEAHGPITREFIVALVNQLFDNMDFEPQNILIYSGGTERHSCYVYGPFNEMDSVQIFTSLHDPE